MCILYMYSKYGYILWYLAPNLIYVNEIYFLFPAYNFFLNFLNICSLELFYVWVGVYWIMS